MINRLISEFLLHSYCYYETSISLISDSEFDNIAKKLLENYDAVEKSNHIHKHLISKDMLTGTTAFTLIGKFPTSVMMCAKQMIYEKTNNEQYRRWWITEAKPKPTMNDLF